MRSFAVIYCLMVALLMGAWWALDIRRGALRRPDRRPAEIGLHLVAEFVTAVLLAAGAIALWTLGSADLVLVALGMLLYTVIQSPGYFLARHQVAPAAMFGVLLVLTVTVIVTTLAL